MEFAIGDVVRLKSGSPAMVVKSISDSTMSETSVWCDSYNPITGSIEGICLEETSLQHDSAKTNEEILDGLTRKDIEYFYYNNPYFASMVKTLQKHRKLMLKNGLSILEEYNKEFQYLQEKINNESKKKANSY